MDWLLSGSELISVWWKEARVNTTSATQRRYRSLRRMPVWGWRDGCWLLFPSTRVRSLTPTCWLTPVYNSSPGDLKASSGTRQEGEHGHPCNQSTHTLKKERKKKSFHRGCGASDFSPADLPSTPQHCCLPSFSPFLFVVLRPRT